MTPETALSDGTPEEPPANTALMRWPITLIAVMAIVATVVLALVDHSAAALLAGVVGAVSTAGSVQVNIKIHRCRHEH